MDLDSLGTANQTEIIEDYPANTIEDKLRVPYIEKQNGNLYAMQFKFENAINHYNKSLLALKMLFEGMNPIITDQNTVIKVVKEVEIPVLLNLALCYNKVNEYHYAIRYCSLALDKNDRHEKAYYRRGMAYLGIGELNKAKQDLTMAYELTQGKDPAVVKGFQLLREKEEQQKKQEKEFSKKIFDKKSKEESQHKSPHKTEEQGKVKESA